MKITHGAFVEYLEAGIQKSTSRLIGDSSGPRALSSFFGRLFDLEMNQPTQEQLNKLAELMLEDPEDESGESLSIYRNKFWLTKF